MPETLDRFAPNPARDAVPDEVRFAAVNHRSLAGMRSPAKVALWLALLRSHEELTARAAGLERVPGGEGGEDRSIPAILLVGEAVVRKSMAGDMSAAGIIFDRIEGKVGMRPGDVDPEAEARRADMSVLIETIATGFTNARLGRPVSGDVTLVQEGEVVHDTETPVRPPAAPSRGALTPEEDRPGVTEAAVVVHGDAGGPADEIEPGVPLPGPLPNGRLNGH